MKISEITVMALGIIVFGVYGTSSAPAQTLKPPTSAAPVTFPRGTATPSEVCGECHKAMYREYAFGFGSDTHSRDVVQKGSNTQSITHPPSLSSTATAHAIAGADPFPKHAREKEEDGKSCNTCHFPEAFDLPTMDASEISMPKPRSKAAETTGLTCASCHLTPDGKIRGPYNLLAPHENYPDVRMKTSVMCAYCHSLGKRIPGRQTQTFFEWRDDFWMQGLGRQNCQDCHMPRTIRKLAEEYNVPDRVAARHLWTGGRSLQRLQNALSLVAVQPEKGGSKFNFHVINIGAGHSVPTGSNRRAVYLQVEVKDSGGKIVAGTSWLFAPWYGERPDDKAYLEEDKKLPDATAAMQADAQGPHEPVIRAGEERILSWSPALKSGSYTVNARIVHDLNRYNDFSISADQTEVKTTVLSVSIVKDTDKAVTAGTGESEKSVSGQTR